MMQQLLLHRVSHALCEGTCFNVSFPLSVYIVDTFVCNLSLVNRFFEFFNQSWGDVDSLF